jgi:hypothetical protein
VWTIVHEGREEAVTGHVAGDLIAALLPGREAETLRQELAEHSPCLIDVASQEPVKLCEPRPQAALDGAGIPGPCAS